MQESAVFIRTISLRGGRVPWDDLCDLPHIIWLVAWADGFKVLLAHPTLSPLESLSCIRVTWRCQTPGWRFNHLSNNRIEMFKRVKQNWRSITKYLKISLEDLMRHIIQIVTYICIKLFGETMCIMKLFMIFRLYCDPKPSAIADLEQGDPLTFWSITFAFLSTTSVLPGALWTRLLKQLVI
jgi:hypothetical protein